MKRDCQENTHFILNRIGLNSLCSVQVYLFIGELKMYQVLHNALAAFDSFVEMFVFLFTHKVLNLEIG